jgi:hypothetical protein
MWSELRHRSKEKPASTTATSSVEETIENASFENFANSLGITEPSSEVLMKGPKHHSGNQIKQAVPTLGIHQPATNKKSGQQRTAICNSYLKQKLLIGRNICLHSNKTTI